MGKVIVPVRIQNLSDLYDVDKGTRTPAEIRQVDVPNALVDTGATFLSLPRPMIEQLGLKLFKKRKARTSAGVVEFGMFEAVRLKVQDRECTVEVAGVPEECPVLLGQLPLESLDFVVDPVGQRLLGNPEHGGEHMMDLFLFSQQSD